MKLPAVAIALAFAGGVWLGLSRFLCNAADHCPIFALLAIGIFFLLLVASLLTWRSFLWSAAIVSLCAWVGLGMLAGLLANQPLPRNHVLTRISNGEIPQKTPLSWRGVLRNEPARLPWGFGLEMNLTGVESAGGVLPIEGGMRIDYTPRDNDSGLPALHAGDTISILSEARLPLVYKDAGAFDRREFLARQNIHLLTTLRSSALLEITRTA
ncbi:MAG TPA: DUF4131 domain-containing protein, partial [Candidatus Acidoferrum sp.]|nr:DUF4131 domain-containing protein [Candidatus Acidoferrum sp.]